MKVILAGYSKTGTKTLAAAFGLIGFNTYDYMENTLYLHKQWLKIFEGKATKQEIRDMYEGVDALTDTPAFLYWKELVDAFPEAKVYFDGNVHGLDIILAPTISLNMDRLSTYRIMGFNLVALF